MDDAESMEVWEQSIQELSLDVRELLITDANVYFVGPDLESYSEPLAKVADLLNYTVKSGGWADLMQGTETIDNLESIFVMPPLVSVQRWSWSVLRQGLVVWLDPDGYEHLNVYERDRIRKLKFPKKKAAFGPSTPPSLLNHVSEEPNGDPIDMWMEADAHVNIQDFKERDIPIEKAILGSIINAILESPPKWRGWMKQAKIRGTIGNDYETPFEARRSFHSNGISPRLNRLLNA